MRSSIYNRLCAVLLLLPLLCVLTGCGGGGGGGTPAPAGGVATITGQVLLSATNAHPTNTATISGGGVSTTASVTDGSFTLPNVPVSTTSITVTVAQTGAAALTRTLSVALTANQTTTLGVIYVGAGANTANVTGRIVTVGSNGAVQGVGNATVTIAGLQTKTSATAGQEGTFSISGLPVGLGDLSGTLLGNVTAPGFEDKQITSETLTAPLEAGANALGDILILQPSGASPAPPYTIRGQVTVQGQLTGNILVKLLQNGNLIGSTTTLSDGSYSFWVVTGTYTVLASQTGTGGQQTSVTLAALDTPVTAPAINIP